MLKKSKPQFARWLYIHYEILKGNYPNCRRIAEQYEVSEKSISRDIAYMKYQLDLPIEYDFLHKGFYYKDKNVNFPLLSLSESDLFSFFILENTLSQYSETPFHRQLSALFSKMKTLMADAVPFKASWLSSRNIFVRKNSAVIPDKIWDTVAQAMEQSRVLELIYKRPWSDKLENRRVHPWYFVYHEGQVYVLAYCEQRRANRSFALSRVKKARLLERSFEYREDPLLRNYAESYFPATPADPVYRFKIRFAREARDYILERTGFHGQKVTEQSDGSLLLEFSHPGLYEIHHWILSRIHAAEVLEPLELIAMLKKDAIALSEKYLKQRS